MNQVSIIISTYKRVNLLNQVLKSLTLQDNIFEILGTVNLLKNDTNNIKEDIKEIKERLYKIK